MNKYRIKYIDASGHVIEEIVDCDYWPTNDILAISGGHVNMPNGGYGLLLSISIAI